tara:strand:- start:777 stop:1058 length:282 start_codon:yes stop_codon:yes gene_type:complete
MTEQEFIIELREILNHRDIKWIKPSSVYFRIDENTDKIILDDEEMLKEFEEEIRIIQTEVAKFNEGIEDAIREKNLDYAMDNMTNDLVYDEEN